VDHCAEFAIKFQPTNVALSGTSDSTQSRTVISHTALQLFFADFDGMCVRTKPC